MSGSVNTNPFFNSQNIANQSVTTSTTSTTSSHISSDDTLLGWIEDTQTVALGTFGHSSEFSTGGVNLSQRDAKPLDFPESNPYAGPEPDSDGDIFPSFSNASSAEDDSFEEPLSTATRASTSETRAPTTPPRGAGVGLDPSSSSSSSAEDDNSVESLPLGDPPPLPPKPGVSSGVGSVATPAPVSNPKVDPHVKAASEMTKTGLKTAEIALMAFLVIGFVACVAAAPFTGGLSLVVAPFFFFAALYVPYRRAFIDIEEGEKMRGALSQINNLEKERSSPTGALKAYEARKTELEAEIKELETRPEKLSSIDQSKLDQAKQDLKDVEEQIARENERLKQRAAQTKNKKTKAPEEADGKAELNGKGKDKHKSDPIKSTVSYEPVDIFAEESGDAKSKKSVDVDELLNFKEEETSSENSVPKTSLDMESFFNSTDPIKTKDPSKDNSSQKGV